MKGAIGKYYSMFCKENYILNIIRLEGKAFRYIAVYQVTLKESFKILNLVEQVEIYTYYKGVNIMFAVENGA